VSGTLSLITLLLLIAAANAADDASTGSTDTGFDLTWRPPCLKLPDEWHLGIPPICLFFQLETCSALALKLNVTYGDRVLFQRTVNDLKTTEICDDSLKPCTTCLQWDLSTFVLNPSYVHMCPVLVTTCTVIGIPIVNRQRLQCLSLGQDCRADTCESCQGMGRCGWCADGGPPPTPELPNPPTGHCAPKGRTGPYCSTCMAKWADDLGECPVVVDENAERNALAWKVGIPVSIGVGLIFCVGVGLVLRKRRAIAGRGPAGYARATTELHSINDSASSATPTAATVAASPSASSAGFVRHHDDEHTLASATPPVVDAPIGLPPPGPPSAGYVPPDL